MLPSQAHRAMRRTGLGLRRGWAAELAPGGSAPVFALPRLEALQVGVEASVYLQRPMLRFFSHSASAADNAEYTDRLRGLKWWKTLCRDEQERLERVVDAILASSMCNQTKASALSVLLSLEVKNLPVGNHWAVVTPFFTLPSTGSP